MAWAAKVSLISTGFDVADRYPGPFQGPPGCHDRSKTHDFWGEGTDGGGDDTGKRG